MFARMCWKKQMSQLNHILLQLANFIAWMFNTNSIKQLEKEIHNIIKRMLAWQGLFSKFNNKYSTINFKEGWICTNCGNSHPWAARQFNGNLTWYKLYCSVSDTKHNRRGKTVKGLACNFLRDLNWIPRDFLNDLEQGNLPPLPQFPSVNWGLFKYINRYNNF